MNYIKTKKELNNFFTKEYYHSINYDNYTTRTKKYDKTSLELVKYFNMEKSTSILDYGCAVGMLLDGFRKAGLEDLNGFDISEWAVNNSIKNNLNLTTDPKILSKYYCYTFSLDVFEHMFDDDVERVLNSLNTSYLVVRIPVKIMNDNDFYLEVSRQDKSHINCKTKGEWIDFIESHGYSFIKTLQLKNIYDSKGCFCGYFTNNKPLI